MSRFSLPLLLSLFVLLAVFAIAGCEADDDSTNETDDPINETDDDDDDDQSQPQLGRRENSYQVVVQPFYTGNPLARRVDVTTKFPCSLSGYVTHEAEPGAGPSYPRATARGTEHTLWFLGLLPDAAFQYRLYETDQPDRIVAAGEFTTPALPSWTPYFKEIEDSPLADRNTWFAVVMNAGRIVNRWLDIYNAVVIYDRQGRVRFLHNVPDPPDDNFYIMSGLTRLSNGDLAAVNQYRLVAVKPTGLEYDLFPIHINQPYYLPSHHQYYVRDHDSEYAFILFNLLGPGLKCDLTTPTDMALGDGVIIVDKSGEEIWRWTTFDHQDLIPPERMDRQSCYGHHYGMDTFDWTHGNGVIPFPGGDAILVSLRNVYMLVKVDLTDGDILWRMGWNTDFTWLGDEPESERWFSMQHDPQWLPNGHLLMFDNANLRYQYNKEEKWSRALELEVDEEAMTVRRVWEHRVPFSHARGMAERHENGNTLIFNGWQGHVVETTPDHQEIWKARFYMLQKPSSVVYQPAYWDYDAVMPDQ